MSETTGKPPAEEPSKATVESKAGEPGFASLLGEIVPVLSFIRRWWPLAVVMVFISSISTVAVVVMRGVEYQVGATLFYKLGTELAPPPTMGKDPLVITRRSEDVNNEIEILTSPDLLRKVVQDLGEEFFTPKPPTTAFAKFKRRLRAPLDYVQSSIEDALIQAGLRQRLTLLEKAELGVASKLKVELVRESDVIAITLDTPAPEAGVTIVTNLIDAYQDRHLQVHQELAVKEFLTAQTLQLRELLAKSTENLLAFQKENDLWSAADQQKMLLDNRKALQMQVAGTSSRLAHLTNSVKNLKSTISDMPEQVQLSSGQQLNPAIVDLEDRLASLNLGSAVISTAYLPSSRESTDKQAQVEALQNRMANVQKLVPFAQSTGLNMARQDLLKELALREAELKGVEDQLDTEKQQLVENSMASQTLGSAIARYQDLEREHQLLEERYDLVNENYEKADIAAVMNLSQISNMELISPPVASLEPVRPRLTIVAAIAIFSGLTLAFAIAVAYDLRSILRSRTIAT